MKADKRKRLEAAGWRVGDAEEFLALDQAEAELVELRLNLARSVREQRTKAKLTQGQLAARLGSSQSRVAKMENADASVTIDLLIRALLSLGRTRPQIASVFGRARG